MSDRDEIEVRGLIPPPGGPEYLCRSPGCRDTDGPDWFLRVLAAILLAVGIGGIVLIAAA